MKMRQINTELREFLCQFAGSFGRDRGGIPFHMRHDIFRRRMSAQTPGFVAGHEDQIVMLFQPLD